MQVRSGDANIFYEVLGKGPDLVLLHPFPVNHHIWDPIAERLANYYRVIRPDLRGHGESETGEGPATMAKHAGDVLKVCEDVGVERAVFCGNSIGGTRSSSCGGNTANGSAGWFCVAQKLERMTPRRAAID